jgi:hypothetical protein
MHIPSIASFTLLLRKILADWEKFPKFKKYFEKQWINSSFSNWQIFRKPIGLSASNGPEESYNNKFKVLFTDKLKYHLIPAMEKFETAIEFESNDKRVFASDFSENKPTDLIKREGKLLSNKNKLIKIHEYVFDYNHQDGTTSRIDVEKSTCECHDYYDRAICSHLIAARLATEEVVPKLTLRTRRRRGPGQKKKRPLSADDAIDLTPMKKNNHSCKGKSALTKEIFPLAKKPKVSRRSSSCSNFEVSLQSDVEPAVVVVPVVYKNIEPQVINTINRRLRRSQKKRSVAAAAAKEQSENLEQAENGVVAPTKRTYKKHVPDPDLEPKLLRSRTNKK